MRQTGHIDPLLPLTAPPPSFLPVWLSIRQEAQSACSMTTGNLLPAYPTIFLWLSINFKNGRMKYVCLKTFISKHSTRLHVFLRQSCLSLPVIFCISFNAHLRCYEAAIFHNMGFWVLTCGDQGQAFNGRWPNMTRQVKIIHFIEGAHRCEAAVSAWQSQSFGPPSKSRKSYLTLIKSFLSHR